MNAGPSLPDELFQKAKQYRWDPQDLDLKADARDWATLDEGEQDVVLNLLSMFVKGEEAVASELAPLLYALGKLGGLKDGERFVASQILDEAIHVEFFHRWFDEVVRRAVDHSAYWGPSYRAVFEDALPAALDALVRDQSSRALTRAFVTYHVAVEGVLAETGYHAVSLACGRRGVLVGLRQGMEYIKRDESRHIAYGIYALQQLAQAEPPLLEFTVAVLNELLPRALAVIPEAIAKYGDEVPFGISLQEMTEYAVDQFNKRMTAIERAPA